MTQPTQGPVAAIQAQITTAEDEIKAIRNKGGFVPQRHIAALVGLRQNLARAQKAEAATAPLGPAA